MLWKLVNGIFLAVLCLALDYDKEYGPDYGTKWIMYLDDNGTMREMNFSSLPYGTRGLVYGDIKFYLYTRQNIDKGELLTIPRNSSAIQSKYFNSSNSIRAATHGWLSKGSTEWLQNIKSALIERSDVNVIVVDWARLAQNPMYHWSAFSTRYVGKRLAKLLKSIIRTYNIEDADIHLMGHSLGAHVMGYAGMFSEKKVQRISGLDPARPLFELPLMRKDFRLDKSDAEFVDIIHTCGGIYGYKNSHGHADFYPNDGKARQPGCDGRQAAIEGCSHGRAHEFFLESIERGSRFTAFPCASWEDFVRGKCTTNATLMGYPAQIDRKGDFYLHTRNHSKFAIDDS